MGRRTGGWPQLLSRKLLLSQNPPMDFGVFWDGEAELGLLAESGGDRWPALGIKFGGYLHGSVSFPPPSHESEERMG